MKRSSVDLSKDADTQYRPISSINCLYPKHYFKTIHQEIVRAGIRNPQEAPPLMRKSNCMRFIKREACEENAKDEHN